MKGARILLIIGGGIAAYKCLELIRRLRDEGASIRAVLTKAGLAAIEAAAPGHVREVRRFLIDHIRDDERPVVAEALERVVGELRPPTTS